MKGEKETEDRAEGREGTAHPWLLLLYIHPPVHVSVISTVILDTALTILLFPSLSSLCMSSSLSLSLSSSSLSCSSRLSSSCRLENVISPSTDSYWSPSSSRPPPHWIMIRLSVPTVLTHLHLQFQGGFVPSLVELQCPLESEETEEKWHLITTIEPEDNNTEQIFDITHSSSDSCPVRVLRLFFPHSTDEHGRIILYQLKLRGKEENPFKEKITENK